MDFQNVTDLCRDFEEFLNLRQVKTDQIFESRCTLQMILRVILFLYSILGGSLQAQERFEFYQGVRQMGMGGASVAVVNDETALLLNPAALGKLRDHFVTVFDPEVALGGHVERVAGFDVMKLQDPQASLNMLNNGHQNRFLSSRAQVFPSIVVPNFGLGFFGRQQMNAQIDSETGEFLYNSLEDFSVVGGVSFRFWQGRLKLGVNARVTNRIEISERTDVNETNLSRSGMAREGIGVGTDIGLILTAPWQWLPTLSAVWRDVGTTSYSWRDGMLLGDGERDRPSVTDESLDLGLAIFPIIGKYARWTWTIEYRDLLTQHEVSNQLSRFHFGGEANIADSVFVRAGVNQGYWTAGVELATPFVQFQLATYGTEVGLRDQRREDRRYNFKVSYRF